MEGCNVISADPDSFRRARWCSSDQRVNSTRRMWSLVFRALLDGLLRQLHVPAQRVEIRVVIAGDLSPALPAPDLCDGLVDAEACLPGQAVCDEELAPAESRLRALAPKRFGGDAEFAREMTDDDPIAVGPRRFTLDGAARSSSVAGSALPARVTPHATTRAISTKVVLTRAPSSARSARSPCWSGAFVFATRSVSENRP